MPDKEEGSAPLPRQRTIVPFPSRAFAWPSRPSRFQHPTQPDLAVPAGLLLEADRPVQRGDPRLGPLGADDGRVFTTGGAAAPVFLEAVGVVRRQARSWLPVVQSLFDAIQDRDAARTPASGLEVVNVVYILH